MVRSQVVLLEFYIDIKSFRSQYGPGVDSAADRNEYQEYFLGGKGGRCVRVTRNLGTVTSWNPLGPSGAVTGLLYLYFLKTHLFLMPNFKFIVHCLCCTVGLVQVRGLAKCFVNLYGEELAPRPNPQVGGQPLAGCPRVLVTAVMILRVP